jgi:hypothetical protein
LLPEEEDEDDDDHSADSEYETGEDGDRAWGLLTAGENAAALEAAEASAAFAAGAAAQARAAAAAQAASAASARRAVPPPQSYAAVAAQLEAAKQLTNLGAYDMAALLRFFLAAASPNGTLSRGAFFECFATLVDRHLDGAPRTGEAQALRMQEEPLANFLFRCAPPPPNVFNTQNLRALRTFKHFL